MSNTRISLAAVAQRIADEIGSAAVRVGSSLEHDFLAVVGRPESWPAVWVGAQRSAPMDDGRGYSQRIRQRLQVSIAVRVIVQRYVAGEVDQEQQLNDLVDAVVAALIGWTPATGYQPLVWRESIDSPPEDAAMSVDMLFDTETVFQLPA